MTTTVKNEIEEGETSAPAVAAPAEEDAPSTTTTAVDVAAAGETNASPEEEEEEEEDLPPLLNPTASGTNDNQTSGSASSTGSTDDEDDNDPFGLNDIAAADGGGDVGTPAAAANAPTDNDGLLVQATLHKEEGNAHFAASEWEKAARCYRRGCSALKKSTASGEVQTVTLFNSLQTNLSTSLCKRKQYKKAAQSASQVIVRIEQQKEYTDVSVESSSGESSQQQQQYRTQLVKALYRRAAAARGTGDCDRAKADLKRALQLEPNNAACRKELLAVKKDVERVNRQQKEALSKAFGKASKSSSLLYGDKETPAKNKKSSSPAAPTVDDKKRLEEELKKQKEEWEDECVKRMAKDEPAVPFEEWQEERLKKAEEDRLEQERKMKEEEAKRKEERKKKQQERKQQQQDSDSDDDDLKLTESELAGMRGYKKTKDGRTTSYFNRELSNDDLELLSDVNSGPKRLTEASNTATANATAAISSAPMKLSATSATTKSAGPSAWNAAGTWEEKDATIWCTDQLRTRLLETTACVDVVVSSSSNLEDEANDGATTTTTIATIVKVVDDISGHASMVMAGGKKRYIYEYNTRLEYQIKTLSDANDDKDKNDDDAVLLASGNVRLPDICSTVSHDGDDLEVTFEKTNVQQPASFSNKHAQEMKTSLARELRAQVGLWIKDFHERY